MSRVRHDTDLLRARLIDVELDDVYRIIPSRFAADPLGCVPSPSRFSDSALGYAVLYAGLTVRCALWEALLRDDFLSGRPNELLVQVVETRALVTIRSSATLRLLDLRGDGTTRARVPTAVTRDRRHAAGRSLSGSLHSSVPEADGIVYDSRFVNDGCVAVYDRALDRLEARHVIPLAASTIVRDALEADGIALVERRPTPADRADDS